jgi:hypothetical protein
MKKAYAVLLLVSGSVGLVGAWFIPWFLTLPALAMGCVTLLLLTSQKHESMQVQALREEMKRMAEEQTALVKKRVETLEAKTGFSHRGPNPFRDS